MIRCHYRNGLYICLIIVCLFFGVVMPPSVIYAILSEAAEPGDYLIAVLFVGVGVCFVGMAVLFFLYVKNWSLVITTTEIEYSNFLGQSFHYGKEEILGYSTIWSSKSHNLGIKTQKKTIWFNSFCSNYYKAKEWIESNYSEWKVGCRYGIYTGIKG